MSSTVRCTGAVLVALGLLASIAGCDRRIDVDFNYAFERRDFEWADEMLRAGADIDARFIQAEGYTTLMLTAREAADPDAVRWLLERGADPEVRTFNGRTALYIASAQGRIEHVRLLLAAGADPGARTDWGTTPLGVAEENGHPDIARLLREAGADDGPGPS